MAPKTVLWFYALLTIACGTQPPSEHPRPLSVAEHRAEAARHEGEASRLKAASRTPLGEDQRTRVACYDNPLVPDPSIGSERVVILRPCWTVLPNTVVTKRAAERELNAAREHRRMANTLARMEEQACSGLGENEIAHSPFFNRSDILSASPILKDGQVLGATVVFRAVPGLDEKWLREAIYCHQMRAASMGYSTTVMSYCPLMVGPSDAKVNNVNGNYQVVLKAKDHLAGTLMWFRVQQLVSK